MIQLMGFFMILTFLLIMGIKYEYLWHDGKGLFTVLYELWFFFANFGPNSTCFIWPAELFATRLRSTCHALSAVARKVRLIVAAFVLQSYTLDKKVSRIKYILMVLAFTYVLWVLFQLLCCRKWWGSRWRKFPARMVVP